MPGAASRLAEFSPGEYPAYLALSAIAIYGCVPETDQMDAIGAMVVCLFIIELVARRSSGSIVDLVATGIVLWSGLFGATGRGSAVVGAWFALWPIVLVLGARTVRPQLALVERLAIGLIGGVAAVAVARTGAIEPTIGPAVVAVAVAAPVSLLAAWGVIEISRRRGAAAATRR